ncbi:MAG: HAMP domain-containing histidine kinase [Firmicutes bacterium]|nr:HAMP domain-containing histidine kinase [Bacillota bacterium]
MNRARPIYSVAVKTVAIFLSVICVLAVVTGLEIMLIVGYDGFTQDGTTDFYSLQRVQSQVRTQGYELVEGDENLIQRYLFWDSYRMKVRGSSEHLVSSDFKTYDPNLTAIYQYILDPSCTNIRFSLALVTEEGLEKLPISTYGGEEYGYKFSYNAEVFNPQLGENQAVWVEVYLLDPLTVEDSFFRYQLVWEKVEPLRAPLLTAGIVSGIVWVFLQVYLLCAAGHKRVGDRDELVQNGLHKIPFDILTGLVFVAMIPFFIFWDEAERMFGRNLYWDRLLIEWGSIAVLAAGTYLILLFYFMSLAIRIKKKNLWSGMLCIRVLRWIGKGVKAFFKAIPQMWKQLALIAGITLGVNFVALLAADSWDGRLVLSMLIWTLSIVIIVKTVREGLYERDRQAVVARLAEGDLASPVELKARGRENQAEAANLSRLRDTVSIAVEKQMQSERLKTELITNVSHDIKTPLTSIINYIDLMKKEGDYTEKQEEYLSVLDKQSVRLKKLIEDLIEASKASTGNIKAEMMPISLGEMLRQLEGEYSEKLEKAELELIMKLPEEEIMVMADGRLLSRVFDNLFSNVIKYSQPGTRVYVDLMKGTEYATVSLRNVSRYPLDISENELMERFTRGDSSRHTEGSGLGLGIALSLVEIMGGRFRINIDADLFKAFVSLKREEKTASLTQSGKSS